MLFSQFYRSEDQKLNKRGCFCLHSWLHVLWRFSGKIDLHYKYMINFVFGPFFEQDSLSVKFHYFSSLFEKIV